MCTTLDIDDDVLASAIELACGQKTTAGKVISGLARKALAGPPGQRSERAKISRRFSVNGRNGTVIAPDTVGELSEENTQSWGHIETPQRCRGRTCPGPATTRMSCDSKR